jgi:hypothetical protein
MDTVLSLGGIALDSLQVTARKSIQWREQSLEAGQPARCAGTAQTSKGGMGKVDLRRVLEGLSINMYLAYNRAILITTNVFD